MCGGGGGERKKGRGGLESPDTPFCVDATGKNSRAGVGFLH